jgi:hypothetical protein
MDFVNAKPIAMGKVGADVGADVGAAADAASTLLSV